MNLRKTFVVHAFSLKALRDELSKYENIKAFHRLIQSKDAKIREDRNFVYRTWTPTCGETAGKLRYDCAVELKDKNETPT